MKLPFTPSCEDTLICIALICFNQITFISGEKQIPRKDFKNKSKIKAVGQEKDLRYLGTLESTQEGEHFSNNEVAGVFKRRVQSLTYKHQNRHLLNKNLKVHLNVIQKNKKELYGNRISSASSKSFGHEIWHHHKSYAQDRNRKKKILYSNRNLKKTPSIRHNATILRPKVFARAKRKHKNHKLQFSVNTRRQMKKIKHRKLPKRKRKELRQNNGQIGGNSHHSNVFSSDVDNRSKNKYHHRMINMETPLTSHDFLSLARHLKSGRRKNHRRNHRLHNFKNEERIESQKKRNERPKHGRRQNLNHQNFKPEKRYKKHRVRRTKLSKPRKNILTKNVVQQYATNRRRLHGLLFQNKKKIQDSRVAEKRRFSDKELQRRKQFDSSPYHNCFSFRTRISEIPSQQKHRCKPNRNSQIEMNPRKSLCLTKKLVNFHHNSVHLFSSDTKRKDNYKYISSGYFSSENKKRINRFKSKKLKRRFHHHFSANQRKRLPKRHDSLLKRVKIELRTNKKYFGDSIGSKKNRKSGVPTVTHEHHNKPRRESIGEDLMRKGDNKIQNKKHGIKFRKQKKYSNGRSNTFFKTTKESNVLKHGTARNLIDSKKIYGNPRRTIFFCEHSRKKMKEMMSKMRTAVRRSIILAKIIGKKLGIDDKTIEAILKKKEAKISSNFQEIK